jgi:AraC-like DNA-binding protein
MGTRAAFRRRTGRVIQHLTNGLRADGLDVVGLVTRAARGAEYDPFFARLLAYEVGDRSGPHPLADVQVPATMVFRLWDEVVRETGGFEAAWRYRELVPKSAAVGTVRMLASTSATLRDGAEQIARYSALFTDVFTFGWADREDGGGMFRIGDIPSDRGALADAIFLTAAVVLGGRRMVGEGVYDRHVSWSVPLTERDVALERTARLPITYGAQDATLVFDPSVWKASAVADDPALNARLEQAARAELALVRGTMTERVRKAIASSEPERLDARVIAKQCAVSSRSMRRALKEEGSSFQRLLDDWRRSVALAWLARESDGELAARLGFADVRAFRRAFGRWTGMTPQRARTSR